MGLGNFIVTNEMSSFESLQNNQIKINNYDKNRTFKILQHLH